VIKFKIEEGHLNCEIAGITSHFTIFMKEVRDHEENLESSHYYDGPACHPGGSG
jgi:hypothetical protein